MSGRTVKHQNLDITSQLNAIQIRLKEFEEQLMKVKGENEVSEQVTDSNLKDMAVNTGIGLKYDEATEHWRHRGENWRRGCRW